jgi:hypothetical protein
LARKLFILIETSSTERDRFWGENEEEKKKERDDDGSSSNNNNNNLSGLKFTSIFQFN